MWSDILNHSAAYESAVLTALDAGSYPFSLRCRPQWDNTAQTLRLNLPAGIVLEPGPACLLWHRHDARLWNLHSFAVRGTLARDETGWYVQPEQFIPGVGVGGWRSYVRFLVNGRRTTRRYLAQRNLARPKLDWDEFGQTNTTSSPGFGIGPVRQGGTG